MCTPVAILYLTSSGTELWYEFESGFLRILIFRPENAEGKRRGHGVVSVKREGFGTCQDAKKQRHTAIPATFALANK